MTGIETFYTPITNTDYTQRDIVRKGQPEEPAREAERQASKGFGKIEDTVEIGKKESDRVSRPDTYGPPDPNAQLSRLFEFYDLDGSGVVSLREFNAVLDKIGADEKAKDFLIKQFQLVETEADGQEGLTKVEVQRLFKVAQNDDQSAFHYYDLNQDGYVTDREISYLAKKYDHINEERVKRIANSMDYDGDGKVSLREYNYALENERVQDTDKVSDISNEGDLKSV
ncbi:MAG: hypothetical protein GC137_08485 [Alphaproteobacteria bacterium]|nr:hypothetical protein [Alphaproteobacteria bacterium]